MAAFALVYDNLGKPDSDLYCVVAPTDRAVAMHQLVCEVEGRHLNQLPVDLSCFSSATRIATDARVEGAAPLFSQATSADKYDLPRRRVAAHRSTVELAEPHYI